MKLDFNIKDKFLQHLVDNNNSKNSVKCARIVIDNNDVQFLLFKKIDLTTGWTDDDWELFLNRLDFNYNKYIYIYGTIWYDKVYYKNYSIYKSSYSSHKLNASLAINDKWDYMKECPKIPDDLNRVDKVREKIINEIIK